jgi:hypothetical protein
VAICFAGGEDNWISNTTTLIDGKLIIEDPDVMLHGERTPHLCYYMGFENLSDEQKGIGL